MHSFRTYGGFSSQHYRDADFLIGFLLALARKPPSVRNDRMFENTIGVHQNPIFEPMYEKIREWTFDGHQL